LLGAGIKARPLGAGAAAPQESSEMLDLNEERRARLIAYVTGDRDMPDAARARVLVQLAQARVPAGLVQRLETRMGG
jgi:hypothetical protein